MNYKVTIAYKGTNYHGFAIQKDVCTIQETIMNCLQELFGYSIPVFASGRTDRYVHAIGQVISFKHKKLTLNPTELKRALNSKLPEDIRVLKVEKVDDKFHARFSAKTKTYEYRVNLSRNYDLFHADLIYQYNKPLDLSWFIDFKNLIIGTHDFLSFSTSEVQDTVRTIVDFNYSVSQKILKFRITGNGFLRNMVRMLIGTYFNLAEQKISLEDVKDYLDHPSKGKAIRKMDGCGLYLIKVNYA